MTSQGNQVPLAPSQRGPVPYPRASTPHRAECYHSPGAAGTAFMPNTAGGAQASALRVQHSPQPQPGAQGPPQDLTKTTMAGHNYGAPQNQTAQARPQYANFQYRPAQHGSRQNSLPRQQQPYIAGAPSSPQGPVMYPLLYQPPIYSNQQTYPQPRSQGYSTLFMGPYINYSNQGGHATQFFFQANNQPISSSNLQASATGPRSNPSALVGPQGAPTTPATLAATIPHQPQTHIHQPMPGIRQTPVKRSHRLAIINPTTKKEVFLDDSEPLSGESSERQTPQPETTHTIAEEFNRMVNEAANQPTASETKSCFASKNADIASTASILQPQSNAIVTNSNIIVKSEILIVNHENKIVGPDVAAETVETPVVSAISDSPVIVPKIPKQFQKNSDQSVVIDSNKVTPTNKQNKQHKSKPAVPQVDDVTKSSNYNVSPAVAISTPVLTPPTVSVAPVFGSGTIPVPVVSHAIQSSVSPATASVFVPLIATPSVFASSPATVPSPMTAPLPATVSSPVSAPLPATVSSPATAPSPATVSSPVTAPLPAPILEPATAPSAQTSTILPPQPQRVRETRERIKPEEKQQIELKSNNKDSFEKDVQSFKPNGPTIPVAISSVDSFPETINLSTSQTSQSDQFVKKQSSSKLDTEVLDTKVEVSNESETPTSTTVTTATQRLSESIDKLTKEQPTNCETSLDRQEASSAIQAQAKLTQSIASCLRTNQLQTDMKDINVNKESIDPDTANGNTDISDTTAEDINKNEKSVKNTKNTNKKAADKVSTNETKAMDFDTIESAKKDETDIDNIDKEVKTPSKDDESGNSSSEDKAELQGSFLTPQPKYKYADDQWSPLNKSGKKYYDVGLLKYLKDSPITKDKPNVALLDAWNIYRTAPMPEPITFSPMSRTMNDTIMPSFLKSPGVNNRNTSRDVKKDGRNMPSLSVKGGGKMMQTSSSSPRDKAIYVSLSLREDVKLNQTPNAWKPDRLKDQKKECASEEEIKTQELYKKFRGILNKLTPQKFETLMEKVQTLEINNRKRLEGVIGLVFEKAIEEPNFSEAYAAMCNKLSMLKVPVDNAPDQYVNFRALIISKCQNQFETNKVDEQVLKLEKEIAECTDPAKKKELQMLLEEENRKVRMRSVGNVRFIGELYKLKMLTPKIMGYCMNHLVDKIEEEKLECLCKLLTTIGQQVENELKFQLDEVFKKMQDIVTHKSNKISSRVRFMIQDVISLRKRNWMVKSVVDSQPKTMDQIQKEAEQQQRHIEIMNANPMGGGFRRDEGNRGKRGDNRRQNNNSNSYMDSQWSKVSRNTFDASKLKAASQTKNVSNTKLAPQNNTWIHGSGAKNIPMSNSMISVSKNKFSALDTLSAEPPLTRGTKDMTPPCPKGASIERSTFAQRTSGSNSRSGSIGMTRSSSGNRSTAQSPATPDASTLQPPSAQLPQEPLPEPKKKTCKSMIDLCLINPDDEELAVEVKHQFERQYHAALVSEILASVIDRSVKDVTMIAKSLFHLVSTNTISVENYLTGMKETFETAPDLFIDIPLLYDYLGKFISPYIENKYITLKQVLGLSESILNSNQGHLLLKAIIRDLRDSMGPSFVKIKWQESGLQLKDWMNEDQVSKWIEDNKFEFLEGGVKPIEKSEKILTPAETQSKLLQLMNADESWECIKGWIHDNLGKSADEDWFPRVLIQAICEHAISGSTHFNQEKMARYISHIHEFGENRDTREANCLIGIQQLIHRLEHPKGITLEIFQYLHEQYIISVDGFIAWENSDKELEGKAVMKVALTSFFTNIQEADNEDSCSED